MAKKIGKIGILLALVALVLWGFYASMESKKPLDIEDNLTSIVVTVDNEEITLQEIMFYIVYEEREIEQQAMVYHPQNTNDYWNLHINGIFIRQDAKDTVMNMAVHDRIFYRMAEERGLRLSAKEEDMLENTQRDFYMDMLEEQKEKLVISDEYFNETMRQIALAQKCQQMYAREQNASYASYQWEGFYYQDLLEEHKVKIHNKIWEPLRMGEVSLTHEDVNYINGYEREEER